MACSPFFASHHTSECYICQIVPATKHFMSLQNDDCCNVCDGCVTRYYSKPDGVKYTVHGWSLSVNAAVPNSGPTPSTPAPTNANPVPNVGANIGYWDGVHIKKIEAASAFSPEPACSPALCVMHPGGTIFHSTDCAWIKWKRAKTKA